MKFLKKFKNIAHILLYYNSLTYNADYRNLISNLIGNLFLVSARGDSYMLEANRLNISKIVLGPLLI